MMNMAAVLQLLRREDEALAALRDANKLRGAPVQDRKEEIKALEKLAKYVTAGMALLRGDPNIDDSMDPISCIFSTRKKKRIGFVNRINTHEKPSTLTPTPTLPPTHDREQLKRMNRVSAELAVSDPKAAADLVIPLNLHINVGHRASLSYSPSLHGPSTPTGEADPNDSQPTLSFTPSGSMAHNPSNPFSHRPGERQASPARAARRSARGDSPTAAAAASMSPASPAATSSQAAAAAAGRSAVRIPTLNTAVAAAATGAGGNLRKSLTASPKTSIPSPRPEWQSNTKLSAPIGRGPLSARRGSEGGDGSLSARSNRPEAPAGAQPPPPPAPPLDSGASDLDMTTLKLLAPFTKLQVAPLVRLARAHLQAEEKRAAQEHAVSGAPGPAPPPSAWIRKSSAESLLRELLRSLEPQRFQHAMHAVNVHVFKRISDERGLVHLGLLFAVLASLCACDFADRVQALVRLLVLGIEPPPKPPANMASDVKVVPWAAAIEFLAIVRKIFYKPTANAQANVPALPKVPPPLLTTESLESLYLNQMPVLEAVPDLCLRLVAGPNPPGGPPGTVASVVGSAPAAGRSASSRA